MKTKKHIPSLGLTNRDVARELARRYSTMTHDELDMLERVLVPMRFSKGENIVSEGEFSTHIFWIVKGLVRLYYIKNGKEVTEHMAAENNMVMCIESLFREEPSKMVMMALENTIVYALSRPMLEQVAMKSVNIQILYRKVLEESLMQSQVQADMLRFETAQGRYARLVETNPQLILRAPLVYVASLLQMAPETLSRVRTSSLRKQMMEANERKKAEEKEEGNDPDEIK